MQADSQPQVGSQHIRRAKNFLKKFRSFRGRSQQLDSQQLLVVWQQLVAAGWQHSAFGAGAHGWAGWQHGAGAGANGAYSAIGTYRGFFTHTVYSWHTGTFLHTVVGHISVTVYGTRTQVV